MRERIHKSNSYIIRINSDTTVKNLSTELGIYDGNGLLDEIPKSIIKRRCCMRAYLRGVFLAGGILANRLTGIILRSRSKTAGSPNREYC